MNVSLLNFRSTDRTRSAHIASAFTQSPSTPSRHPHTQTLTRTHARRHEQRKCVYARFCVLTCERMTQAVAAGNGGGTLAFAGVNAYVIELQVRMVRLNAIVQDRHDDLLPREAKRPRCCHVHVVSPARTMVLSGAGQGERESEKQRREQIAVVSVTQRQERQTGTCTREWLGGQREQIKRIYDRRHTA